MPRHASLSRGVVLAVWVGVQHRGALKQGGKASRGVGMEVRGSLTEVVLSAERGCERVWVG
jgi:hypothetical protein